MPAVRKRKMWWLSGLFVLALTGAAAALGAVVKHEPNFYRQSKVPPGALRQTLAATVVSNSLQMRADIEAKRESWGCDATEAQLNSLLDEFFDREGETEGLRKLGISAPHVSLED